MTGSGPSGTEPGGQAAGSSVGTGPVWSPDDASVAVSRLLGVPVTAGEPVPCSAGNQAFVLRAGSDAVVMKTATPEVVRSEAAVLALLAGHGIPVPVVVAADPDGEVAGRSVLVTALVDGAPLDGPAPERAEVGGLLRRVHALDVDGVGTIRATPDGLRGTATSWSDALSEPLARLDEVVAAGHLDPGLAVAASSVVTEVRPFAGPGRLLHGDLHPRHVFVRDGRVAAVIDWGDALAGDPAYDLGRLLHAGVVGADLGRGRALLDAVAEGYGPLPPWEDMVRCAVAFVARAMVGELDGGSPWPPWWELQAVALRALLDRLDAP